MAVPLRIKAKQLDAKHRLELYALIYFIAAYRRLFPAWPTLIEMPLPPEPDFVVRLGVQQLGIEIAHLFGSERDARLLLGCARPDESTPEARLEHAQVPLDVRVPMELNRILWQKAKKTYPRPTWLVIRNAYPLWKRSDFEMYPTTLDVPGFGVERAAWTPDSQFFVYSMSSSGGHQAWHFPTEFIAVKDHRVQKLDDFIGRITDPDFELHAPDVVHTVGRGKENLEEKTFNVALSSLVTKRSHP